MDMWDIKLNNIQKICRICLEEHNTMNNIYQNENIYEMSVVELLNNFLCLKIEEYEELSSLICNQCETEVFQFCEFKLKFDKSNKFFQEYLTQLENTNIKKEQHVITEETEDDAQDSSIIIQYPSEVVEILSDAGTKLDTDVLEFVEDLSDNEIESEQKKVIKVREKPNKCDDDKPVYTCNICKEDFESKIKLTDHRRKLIHYKHKTVTCSKCKIPVPVQNYKSHLLTHSSDFRCELCSKTFANKYNLNKHLYVHTRQTPFSCDLCGAKFSRQDKLKKHITIHSYEKPFTCETCGQQFRRKDKLRLHQEKYNCIGNDYKEKFKRTLSCDVCSKSFAVLSSLNTHKLLHTDDCVICSICDKPYPNEKKLNEHKLLVHSEKKFLCNFCAKQCTSNWNLRRHILTHLSIPKSYNCKICNKSFTEPRSLALHLKTHTGEKPFVCHVCAKAFNRLCNLQRHLQLHDNIRPYVCAICEKRFTVKYSLIVHTRIHTGEKPYECPVCGQKFSARKPLSKHVKIHNGQN